MPPIGSFLFSSSTTCSVFAFFLTFFYSYQVLPIGTAFIIGNEAKGLSDEVLRLADLDVGIPTKAESLNASVACGILAYEAFRQRNV